LNSLLLISTIGATLKSPHRKYIEQVCHFLSGRVVRRISRGGNTSSNGINTNHGTTTNSGRSGGGVGQYAQGETLIECLLCMNPMTAKRNGMFGRSQFDGQLLPNLSAMKRVASTIHALSLCVACPAAFSKLSNTNNGHNNTNHNNNSSSSSSSTSSTASTSPSFHSIVMGRIVDLMTTYSLPPHRGTQSGRSSKIARIGGLGGGLGFQPPVLGGGNMNIG